MSVDAAARAILEADHLLVTAGAGIGVDSGLPDFRGAEGFWAAYPPYRGSGIAFEDVANPGVFRRDPALAWGFYGHRLALYRRTAPHAGFELLRRWGEAKASAFVVTSNVDGHFARAGFDPARIHEIHGSIHHLQCVRPCRQELVAADAVEVEVDEQTMRAVGPLPRCPRCGGLARPGILMFGDGAWVGARSDAQGERYEEWLEGTRGGRLCVVELGAGTAIASIRRLGERLLARAGAALVRINPAEASGPRGTLAIDSGALAALAALDARMSP
jgi:NAD-dependent SIR2 family protein deacetylase